MYWQKVYYTLIILLCLSAHAAFGRSLSNPTGARSAGMGNAQVGAYHSWAVMHNPAGTAKSNAYSFAIDYENRFLVPELSMRSVTATLPFQFGNFALLYSSFGPRLWQENQAKISYSRMFGPKISGGLSFNYLNQKLPDTGETTHAAGFDIGLIWQISASTNLGFSALNPLSTPIKLSTTTEKIPWQVRLGATTAFQPSLKVGYEISMIESEKLLFRSGFEWEAAQNFFIRWGIDSNPRFSAGLGFVASMVKIDVAFSYHQFLGYSPTISLQIDLP